MPFDLEKEAGALSTAVDFTSEYKQSGYTTQSQAKTGSFGPPKEDLLPPGTAEADQANKEGAKRDPSSKTKEVHPHTEFLVDKTSTRYILEMYVVGEKAQPYLAMPLPRQPAYKNISKAIGQSVRYTLGSEPIRQHTPDRMWMISFGGMTGIADRQYVVSGQARTTHMPGIRACMEFDSFLSHYQARAYEEQALYIQNKGGVKSFVPRVWLVLRDFDEGLSWKVETVSFDWTRNAGTTRVANAEWKVQFHAYANSDRVSHRTMAASSMNVDTRKLPDLVKPNLKHRSWPAPLKHDKFKSDESKDKSFLSSALSSPAWGSSVLSNAKLPLAEANKHLKVFNEKVKQFRDLIALGTALAKISLTLYADIIRSGESVINAFFAIRSAGMDFFGELNGLNNRVANIFSDVSLLVSLARHVFGARRGPRELLEAPLTIHLSPVGEAALPIGQTSGFVDASRLDSLPTVTKHVVKQGETWQSIAQMYLGSVDYWAYLASFNGGSSGYLMGDGMPFEPGTTILIPGQSGSGTSITTVFAPGDLFGTDLYIDPATGDLAFNDQNYSIAGTDFVPATPDWKSIGGIGNFKQAMWNLLLTPRGYLSFIPSYGLVALGVGDEMNANTAAYLVSSSCAAFFQDPRVVTVKNLSIQIIQNQVAISATIGTFGQSTVRVVAPLQMPV